MLTASVPQVITSKLARDVLEVDNPQPLIERLLDEGLLQDSGSDEYSFHPLLRDFLRRKIDSEMPDLAVTLAERALEYAKANSLWDEAFTLSLRLGDVDAATAIIGEAAPTLLASGRIETLEKWLTACGPGVVRQPTAVLAKGETLIRQGRLMESLGLARDICRRLPSDAQHASWAHALVGEAAHFLSQDELALENHLLARDCSRSNDDLRRALWGAFLASVDLEEENAEGYLDMLEEASGDDIDSRLRIAMGRAIAARAQGSVAGVLSILEPLLPLAEFAFDPMIRSGFLAYTSYLNSLRSRYEVARKIAVEACRVCAQFRLDFEGVLCELTRAHAEIGLRRAREARKILLMAGELSPRFEDPFLEAELAVLSVKLSLLQGDLPAARVPPPASLRLTPPKSIRGEEHALAAVVAAAAGESSRAAEEINAARTLTSTVEAVYLSAFAELLLEIRDGRTSEDIVRKASSLLVDAYRADVLDTVVTTYRSYPEVLRLLREDAAALSILRRTLLLSHDQELARRVGFPVHPSEPESKFTSLTKRELEVLDLVCEGLTNREIANRLVIAESTAKVHVHNLLRKLSVHTRLQAAVLAKDALHGT
jgi:ATP/maltotriose-dependent transcriptional regulator MalT